MTTEFLAHVSTFIGGYRSLDANTIYSCLHNLWTSLSSKPSSLEDAYLGVEILVCLIDHESIIQLSNDLHIPIRKRKMSAAFDIVYVMWNVWHIGQHRAAVTSIKILQKKWRARRSKCKVVNTHDPFTMEVISDMHSDSVFQFWEYNGISWHLFAFSGVEFYKYVFDHKNNTNPLTRHVLSAHVCRSLQQWKSSHVTWHDMIPVWCLDV